MRCWISPRSTPPPTHHWYFASEKVTLFRFCGSSRHEEDCQHAGEYTCIACC
jgi:hypothetical protein